MKKIEWNSKYNYLVNKTFLWEDNQIVIRHRQPTEKKTELYLWNNTRMCYISGLVDLQENGLFSFKPFDSDYAFVLNTKDFSIKKL